jgi:hypothetical protein
MNFLQRFFRSLRHLLNGKNRSDWEGFKEIKDAKVDTPEEFRDRNVT